MPTGSRNGRIAARITYDAVIGYIGKAKDSNAEFYTLLLGTGDGHRYYRNGIQRLENRGIVKVVRKERYGKRNIYKLSDGMSSMGLDEILNLPYPRAVMMFNGK